MSRAQWQTRRIPEYLPMTSIPPLGLIALYPKKRSPQTGNARQLHLCAARSRHIFLPTRLSFLPRLQIRPIAIERIVVHVKDTRVARSLAAIIAARAHGRHGTRIVVVR